MTVRPESFDGLPVGPCTDCASLSVLDSLRDGEWAAPGIAPYLVVVKNDVAQGSGRSVAEAQADLDRVCAAFAETRR